MSSSFNYHETEQRAVLIDGVLPDSPAARAGIRKGWKLLSINGQIVKDLIDYRFLISDSKLRVEVEDSKSKIRTFEITKHPDRELGLIFENPLFDGMRHCKNKCIFCFFDQMPPNLRKSLYEKDEDYRLSFLFGNYITLTNITEEDLERIKALNLSPLYVSVHATEPRLRRRILGTKKQEDIMSQLEELTSSGITIHTQIVLMPGINDGEALENTINDLSSLAPSVASIAIVPVGLTRFREELFPLKPVDRRQARNLIATLKPLQKKFERAFETPLVFLSDEFYFLAGEPVPEDRHYLDYPQLENGVGMTRKFLSEYRELKNSLPGELRPARSYLIVTGELGAKAIGNTVQDISNRVKGLSLELFPVKNDFFGHEITVTGLVTGQDIISALSRRKPDRTVVIPDCMLNRGRFLDDVTVEEIKQELGVEVLVVPSSVKGFLSLLE